MPVVRNFTRLVERKDGGGGGVFFKFSPGSTFLTESRGGDTSRGRLHSAPCGIRPQPLRWAAGGSNQPAPAGARGPFSLPVASLPCTGGSGVGAAESVPPCTLPARPGRRNHTWGPGPRPCADSLLHRRSLLGPAPAFHSPQFSLLGQKLGPRGVAAAACRPKPRPLRGRGGEAGWGMGWEVAGGPGWSWAPGRSWLVGTWGSEPGRHLEMPPG